MCQHEFVVKSFFDELCGLNFLLRKCPVAVELNLKHRKLTNVVQQTRNVSTWSDRGKTLPLRHVLKKLTSTSCLLGIRKSNEHCSKVVSGCCRNPSYGHTRMHDGYGHTGMHDNIDLLHKWRLYLNNNTYTSLASHS